MPGVQLQAERMLLRPLLNAMGLPDGPASSRDLLRTELLPLSSAGRLPLSALVLSFPLMKALLVVCVMLLIRMFTGSVDICCPSAQPRHWLLGSS